MHPEPWVEQDEPLASDWHHEDQEYAYLSIRWLLGPERHYVTRDRWLRMDPKDPNDRLVPDLLIALDVPVERRESREYRPTDIGKPPAILGEFLSPSSDKSDLRDKPVRYAQLGVREYFVFDPGSEYAVPPIQGWALHPDGSRQPIPPDDEGGVTSRLIPVRFMMRSGRLAVQDTRTGEVMPSISAALAAHREARAEIVRLREELDRLRRERGTS